MYSEFNNGLLLLGLLLFVVVVLFALSLSLFLSTGCEEARDENFLDFHPETSNPLNSSYIFFWILGQDRTGQDITANMTRWISIKLHITQNIL